MLESLKVWLDSVRFAYEVQTIISMRRVLLAGASEARRMVAEPRHPVADAEAAIIAALGHGEALMLAAERAYAPVRRWVGANNRRLLAALGTQIKV